MDARAATIIADRYQLSERVGQGGCGVVYRATDRNTGHPVAIKMLSHATRQDPSFVERLVREQQVLQALAGTHAVGAIDLCRANTGELCLVMEWLAGTDLEQRLSELEKLGTPLDSGELWRIMEPVLQTLEKAHELGIVHRDVKPANIFLLSDDAGVRLLDFGFSRLKSSATLTAADMVMGSPSYIAPEAWQHGSKAIEKQADLYAAGVIVFRALAGRVPFEGASLVETMKLVTSAPRPSLCELRGDLPLSMDEWVRHALAIAPERRFQHASSFLEALGAALGGRELPPHTLPATSKNPETAPPPKTTPGERQNALSLALGRAASLLKRVAHSFSRAPADTTPPDTKPADMNETVPRAPANPAPAPLVREPPPPPEPALTKPSEPPRVRAEPDELIAELLPTSLPPPPLADASTPPSSTAFEAHTVVEMYEPLTPSRTISIEASGALAKPPQPPPTAPVSEPEPLPKSAKPTKKPRPTAERKRKGTQRKGTQRKATQPEAAPPKATQPKATQPKATQPKATQPKATRRRATRPKAAKQQLPERAPAERTQSSPPAADTRAQRRSKKTTAAAPSPQPKAPPKRRKRATKQAATTQRAPAKTPAKSARANSGNPDTSQTSKRTAK